MDRTHQTASTSVLLLNVRAYIATTFYTFDHNIHDDLKTLRVIETVMRYGVKLINNKIVLNVSDVIKRVY